MTWKPDMRRIVFFALLPAVTTCSSDTTSPPDDTAVPIASVDIVSGNGQTDTVGQELPGALVVAAKDAKGQPVPRHVITFVVTAGGGKVFGGANSTNRDGIAYVRWTLGTSTADSQVVEVRAVDSTSGQPKVFARFEATAVPDVPTTLSIVSGNAQTGALGEPLADSAVTRLADQYGNGTPGEVVSWLVLTGGGSVTPESTTTGPSGRAATQWTLGMRPDTTHVLLASTFVNTGGDLDPILMATFTATPRLPIGTVTRASGTVR
jgi:hypothetical protein